MHGNFYYATCGCLAISDGILCSLPARLGYLIIIGNRCGESGIDFTARYHPKEKKQISVRLNWTVDLTSTIANDEGHDLV